MLIAGRRLTAALVVGVPGKQRASVCDLNTKGTKYTKESLNSFVYFVSFAFCL